jgi:hypothetical protein
MFFLISFLQVASFTHLLQPDYFSMATSESYDGESYGDDGSNESSESLDNHTEGVSEDERPAAAVAPLPEAIVVAQDAAARAGRGDG